MKITTDNLIEEKVYEIFNDSVTKTSYLLKVSELWLFKENLESWIERDMCRGFELKVMS